MTAALLLTLDVGTTNCKAVAYALDGTTVASATTPYPTQNPREGWYEQRPSDWVAASDECLRELAAALGPAVAHIAGLCLSAWGPGLVLLDAEGLPLNDVSPTWQDVRSIDHGRHLVERVGPGWVGGGMPLTGFPAKLAWALDAWPDEAAAAAHAVGVKDFLVRRLTGTLATEPSSGPYARAWPSDVFDAIGWEVGRLPPVVDSTDVVGGLLEEPARTLGLPAGLPVIAGINDGAAATVGVGARRNGDAVVSLGTNGVFRVVTTTPIPPEVCLERSLFRYPLVSELWVCGGFVLSGGSALAWLAGAVAAPGAETEIDELLREAADTPAGSDGVLFLPYLVGKGSPAPDPAAAAAFVGLRARHGRGQLTRAVLEGVAFGVRDIAATYRGLGLEPRRLLVTGGGAASPLWREILAGVLGLSVGYAVGDSNRGAAAVLAAALGLARDVEEAVERLVPELETTATTPDAIAIYDDAYRTFTVAAERLTGGAQ